MFIVVVNVINKNNAAGSMKHWVVCCLICLIVLNAPPTLRTPQMYAVTIGIVNLVMYMDVGGMVVTATHS